MILNPLFTKAKDLFYSNATSGLSAKNVQSAIDEVLSSVKSLENDMQFKVLTIPEKEYSFREYINYLKSTLGSERAIAVGMLSNFTDESEFINYFDSTIGSCVVQITYITSWLFEAQVTPVHSGWRYEKRLVCTYNPASATTDEELYRAFRVIPWKSDLDNFINQINRDYYGTNGETTPFDLMPNGTTGTSLSRLGSCYISSNEDAYHAPVNGYALAFGGATYRYGVLYIGRDGDFYFRSDTTGWIKVAKDTAVKGTTIWENTDIASGTEWDSVDIDTSLYTHFEVLYAESIINNTGKPNGLRTTGKLPINSGCEDFALIGRNSVEIFDTHRDCSIDSNGNLVWQNCVYYDSEYNEGSDSKKCVPLKVIAY